MKYEFRFLGFRVRKHYISLRVGTRQRGLLVRIARKGDNVGSYLAWRWDSASWMVG